MTTHTINVQEGDKEKGNARGARLGRINIMTQEETKLNALNTGCKLPK